VADTAIRLLSFDGGWNTFKPDIQLNSNESPWVDNVELSQLGSLQRRNGYTAFLETGLSSDPLLGLTRFWRISGAKMWLAACDKSLYAVDDLGASTEVYSLLDGNYDLVFAFLNDKAFTVEPTVGLLETQGTVVTTSVIDARIKCQYIVTHHSRLFAANLSTNPSRLMFSNVDDETTWDAADYIDIDEDDGDEITGLASSAGVLYIFKNNSVHALYGVSQNDFYRRKLVDNVGCVAPKSIVSTEDGVFFASQSAYMLISDAGIQTVSNNIRPTYLSLVNKHNIASVDYKQQVWIAVDPDADGNNTEVYVFDRLYGRWTRYTNIAASCFAVSNAPGEDIGLKFGSSASDGYIYTADTGTNDNGTAITLEYETAYLGGQLPELVKRWRTLTVDATAEGSSPTITWQIDVDGPSGQFDLTLPNVTRWGDGVWGTFVYNATPTVNLWFSFPQKAIGKAIKLTISHVSDAVTPVLNSIAMMARAKRYR